MRLGRLGIEIQGLAARGVGLLQVAGEHGVIDEIPAVVQLGDQRAARGLFALLVEELHVAQGGGVE